MHLKLWILYANSICRRNSRTTANDDPLWYWHVRRYGTLAYALFPTGFRYLKLSRALARGVQHGS